MYDSSMFGSLKKRIAESQRRTKTPERPMPLFLKALLGHWWALMSCAAFTFLGVYAAAANKASTWIVAGIGFLAVLFFVVAAFKTWADEHRKCVAEIAKNQKPDIRGEAFDFLSSEGSGEGNYRDHWRSYTDLTFELFLCNQRPVTSNLRAIELDGTQLVPPVTFDVMRHAVNMEPDLTTLDVELSQGMSRTLSVNGTATVYGMRLADVPPIMLDKLIVTVIDGFEQRHRIRVRAGERLRFGQR